MNVYKAKKIGTQYSQHESLIVYRTGQTISIDRTYRGEQWCKSRGMLPTYTATTDSNEKFTVWTGNIKTSIGSIIPAACAIPA